jgi:hypothetical protein
MFDPEYYVKVLDLINSRDWLKFDIWYNIDDYTDTPEKLIYHLKYYIDRQLLSGTMITLSDDHRTKFKLEEPFYTMRGLFSFQATKKTTPLPQLATESKTVKKKDPFASLRPKAKQGELF